MFNRKLFPYLGILALLGAGSALADPGHANLAQVHAVLERRFLSGAASSSVLESPAATTTKVSPLLQFSLHGTGAENATIGTGTCSGNACAASMGDCSCLMFTGNVNATDVGNATWTADITVNTDDCTNTGTPPGFCCFGDGVMDATTIGKSPSTLEISFTGPVCADPNANGDSVQGGFIIVTANSTGKFANSAGTGEINFFVADDLTTYLSGNGVFQLTAPTPTATPTP